MLHQESLRALFHAPVQLLNKAATGANLSIYSIPQIWPTTS